MIYDKLYDWQKKLVDLFDAKLKWGLFLDCGLGKTPISLAFAERNMCKKVIVVTINSKALETETVNGSWLWWAKQSSMQYQFKYKWSTEFSDDAELLLVNYESLFKKKKRDGRKQARMTLSDKIVSFITSCTNENVALIIDESHKVKNLQSSQTLAITSIQSLLTKTSKSVHTYLLTGTPFTTGYIDLYTQLKLLGNDMTKTEFIDRFCERGNVPGLLGWQQPIVGYKNIDALFKLVKQFGIFIDSDDVVKLPKKVFVNYSLPQTKEFVSFISEKMKASDICETFTRHAYAPETRYLVTNDVKMNNPFYRNIDYPDYSWLAETSGTMWLRARQLSIGFQGNAENAKWYDTSRLTKLKQFLSDRRDNYIIFYNFTPELLEIYQICEDLNYNIDVYCGEMKSTIFYDKYCSMTDDKKITNCGNVIIANFASGATGMNWQAYNKCVIFSCPLYKDYKQGYKRISRIGQTNTTIYYFFYQANWLDVSMRHALTTQTNYSTDLFESDLDRVNQLLDESM